VIVGKPGSETPQMAALLRFALVNPHWDIPPDLVRHSIAPKVRAAGPDFLEQRDYVAVDRYGQAPQVLDAAAVDWAAVEQGKQRVGIRQRPGPSNMMGRVLFMFPNMLGIYLHDTPGRANFLKADRHISNGCVRVERAAELYRWAWGHDLPAAQSPPDHEVPLNRPVPVFLIRFSPAGSEALRALGPLSA
jgi:murein L,D-transpeptidase YcbB/YkuD